MLWGAGSWQARTPLRTLQGVRLLPLTLPSSYSSQPLAGGSPKPSPASQNPLLPLLFSGQFSILTAPQECVCQPSLDPCSAHCLRPLRYPPSRPHILFFPTEALLTAMPPSLCCLRLALRRFACPPPDSGCLPFYGAGACALLGPSPTLVREPEPERNRVISKNRQCLYGAITSSPCGLAVRRSLSSPGPGDLSIFPSVSQPSVCSLSVPRCLVQGLHTTGAP